MQWGSTEGAAVRLVFLSAVPATDASEYLRLLSGLTRLSKQPDLVEQLHNATDSEEIMAVLKQVKLRESSPTPAVAI